MSLDAKLVIGQIDAVLEIRRQMQPRSEFSDLSDLPREELAAWATLAGHTIQRFAPEGSEFRDRANQLSAKRSVDDAHSGKLYAGVLEALRRAYEFGYLETVQELVHAEVFSDFLEMAEYLLTEGYKDPAAVLSGGVLEEHLRKLCGKASIPTANSSGETLKASRLNDELKRNSVYDGLEQKNVTAWLDLRNKAAHGKYAEYDARHVEDFIRNLRSFLARHRA